MTTARQDGGNAENYGNTDMKTHVKLLGAALALCITSAARSATLFSNLGTTDTGGLGMTDTDMVFATDFLTSGSATVATSATVALGNFDSADHHVVVEILSNSTGSPGTLVGTFGTLTVPASQSATANYTAASAGISLSANTKYWIAIRMLEPGFFVNWSETGSQATDAGSLFATVPTTQVKDSDDGGATYDDSSAGNFRFALSSTAVPEPGSAAIAVSASLLSLLRRRHRPA